MAGWQWSELVCGGHNSVESTNRLLLGPFSSRLSPSELLLTPLPALIASLLPGSRSALHATSRLAPRISALRIKNKIHLPISFLTINEMKEHD